MIVRDGLNPCADGANSEIHCVKLHAQIFEQLGRRQVALVRVDPEPKCLRIVHETEYGLVARISCVC